jgi:hypothetical protein
MNSDENRPFYDNPRFSTGIGPMTDRLLNTVFEKLSSDNFRQNLEDKIIDPITDVVSKKMRPYIYTSIVLYIILLILLIAIIVLLIRKK